jgi:hypothetical protein
VEGLHFTTDFRGSVTVVTARDGLFDTLPETDESAPLAAEVIHEFRSTVTDAAAVVVDLRGASEVNKRTLSVTFQFAAELATRGIPRALCGSAVFKDIWDSCRGETFCRMYEGISEACAAVVRA